MLLREKQKRELHRRLLGDDAVVDNRDSVFVPFIVEVTGKLSASAKRLIDSLDVSGWRASVLQAQLGSLLMRYNVMMFKTYFCSKRAGVINY
jgi:hypothetical protein